MRFFSIGLLSFLIGTSIGIRFLLILFRNDGVLNNGTGHVQSLILAAIFLLFGAFSTLVGFVSEQIARNRNMLEDLLHRERLIAIDNQKNKLGLDLLVYSKDD